MVFVFFSFGLSRFVVVFRRLDFRLASNFLGAVFGLDDEVRVSGWHDLTFLFFFFPKVSRKLPQSLKLGLSRHVWRIRVDGLLAP